MTALVHGKEKALERTLMEFACSYGQMTNLNSLSYADTSSKVTVTAKHIWSWHTVVGQSHDITKGTQGTTSIAACSHCRHLGPKRAPNAGYPSPARGVSKNQQVSETTCKGINARFRIHFEGITLRKHHGFDKPAGGGDDQRSFLWK